MLGGVSRSAEKYLGVLLISRLLPPGLLGGDMRPQISETTCRLLNSIYLFKASIGHEISMKNITLVEE